MTAAALLLLTWTPAPGSVEEYTIIRIENGAKTWLASAGGEILAFSHDDWRFVDADGEMEIVDPYGKVEMPRLDSHFLHGYTRLRVYRDRSGKITRAELWKKKPK